MNQDELRKIELNALAAYAKLEPDKRDEDGVVFLFIAVLCDVADTLRAISRNTYGRGA